MENFIVCAVKYIKEKKWEQEARHSDTDGAQRKSS